MNGEIIPLSVLIVDLLVTEAILGSDVLKHCVINVSHEQLIRYRYWPCCDFVLSRTRQTS